MRRYIDKNNNFGIIWSASCRANLSITLSLIEEHGYQYDGDDEDGSIQRDLDNGDLVAFMSIVQVFWYNSTLQKDIAIGSAALHGSVYKDGETHQFVHDGYFMDMLKDACGEARQYIAEVRETLPALREG